MCDQKGTSSCAGSCGGCPGESLIQIGLTDRKAAISLTPIDKNPDAIGKSIDTVAVKGGRAVIKTPTPKV